MDELFEFDLRVQFEGQSNAQAAVKQSPKYAQSIDSKGFTKQPSVIFGFTSFEYR